MRQQVEETIDVIRPALQADGGDIVLVDVLNNRATVRLTGKCAGCPSAHVTLHVGVEMAIRAEFPELEELIVAQA